jgi:hypothetical protein
MYISTPNPKLICRSYEVNHAEKWFWVSNMEISRTSQKLHFRVTKKDPGLLIRFHVLNLSKSWSNLGFYQDSNAQKIKKIRKMKNQST